jgi:hypothetical protein
MRAADPEGKIAMHAVSAAFDLIGQRFRAGRLRIGVWHFKHGSYTTEGGCA